MTEKLERWEQVEFELETKEWISETTSEMIEDPQNRFENAGEFLSEEIDTNNEAVNQIRQDVYELKKQIKVDLWL